MGYYEETLISENASLRADLAALKAAAGPVLKMREELEHYFRKWDDDDKWMDALDELARLCGEG
jgi:hypothetical protein